MPQLRDLLYRLRPAGAPGAAGAAGVPADRDAGLAAELAPLVADLAGTEQDCARLRDRARRAADGLRARADERSVAILAAAQDQVAAVRDAAVATAWQQVGIEVDSGLAAVQRDAAALRERARERTPEHVEQVVAAVRALIGAEHAEQPVGAR